MISNEEVLTQSIFTQKHGKGMRKLKRGLWIILSHGSGATLKKIQSNLISLFQED